MILQDIMMQAVNSNITNHKELRYSMLAMTPRAVASRL